LALLQEELNRKRKEFQEVYSVDYLKRVAEWYHSYRRQNELLTKLLQSHGSRNANANFGTVPDMNMAANASGGLPIPQGMKSNPKTGLLERPVFVPLLRKEEMFELIEKGFVQTTGLAEQGLE
jgi:hypothetical protein